MVSSNDSTRRTRRTADQWQQLVNEFEASGLSAAQFCQRHHLGLSTLGKWRSRFRDQPKSAAPFVELAMPTQRAVSAESNANSLHMRLDLGSGVVLEISRP